MDPAKEISFFDFESTLDNLENEPTNLITKSLELVKKTGSNLFKTSFIVKFGLKLCLFFAYNAFLVYAIIYHVNNDSCPIGWCDGVGFLIVCTGLAYIGFLYYKVVKPRQLFNCIFLPFSKSLVVRHRVQVGCGVGAIVGLVGFLLYDTAADSKRLQPCFGMVLLIVLGVLGSKHPGRIRWRHVVWGLGLQLTFGLLILRTVTGRLILSCMSDKVTTFSGFVDRGSSFVYGYLATGMKIKTENGETELPGIFAFQILSIIYFFSFFVAILYHFGVMTWIVSNMGWLFEISVGTTAAESMNASANIFLGLSEAPLVVKPFIAKMTNSELHAVMTGGFATVAGAALGAYVTFGIDPFHLLSATVMSAPAALMYSKILYPETKKSATNSKEVYDSQTRKVGGNFLEAASEGAAQAVFLICNIIASLIAISACIGMLNVVIHWFGTLVGLDQITFEWVIGKIFTPLAWCIGIDNNEVEQVAYLLGVKTVVNEFVAYSYLTKMCLSPRTVTITTYALCSFSNLTAIGVALGSLRSICPERGRDISNLVFRSFIGGNVASLLTACVAATLNTDINYEEWKNIRNCTNSTNYL